jgi:(S)-3,5-dihydroxyphenylglycine transaminase
MSTCELDNRFDDPLLSVMNFLNDVVAEFPQAISLAPGRPLDQATPLARYVADAEAFVADASRRQRVSAGAVWSQLAQYSRTNGIILEQLAQHLAVDEGIFVPPDAIVMTVGAQEALAIIAASLFASARDILLVSNPTYVGMPGVARLMGVRVMPVDMGPDGLEPDQVDRAIRRGSVRGRVRALYHIPDFNNPLGTSMPLTHRRELLRVCEQHGVLLVEDNPYGMFAYDHPPLPTLKALDQSATVLYVGSFSKTLAPAFRLGYLVADQQVGSSGQPLAVALSKAKSLLTVNTPPLLQAIVAGRLLQTGGTLRGVVEPARLEYRRRRDTMAAALQAAFTGLTEVSWRVPSGGFFLPVTLPFAFGRDEVRRCALDHGVIVCPMRFFSLTDSHTHQVRLSFSSEEPDRIQAGIARFAEFVREHLARPRGSRVRRGSSGSPLVANRLPSQA